MKNQIGVSFSHSDKLIGLYMVCLLGDRLVCELLCLKSHHLCLWLVSICLVICALCSVFVHNVQNVAASVLKILRLGVRPPSRPGRLGPRLGAGPSARPLNA